MAKWNMLRIQMDYAAEVVSSVSLDILIFYFYFFHCATVTKNKFNCKRQILG